MCEYYVGVDVYLWMCVCMCVLYVYVYVRICVCMYFCTHVCLYINMRACAQGDMDGLGGGGGGGCSVVQRITLYTTIQAQYHTRTRSYSATMRIYLCSCHVECANIYVRSQQKYKRCTAVIQLQSANTPSVLSVWDLPFSH